MKGLEEYIKAHGMHFTDRLATDLSDGRWTITRVRKTTQKKIYYNVTKSTFGDMLYIIDMVCSSQKTSVNEGVRYALDIVGDFYVGEGYAFGHFINSLILDDKDFDFTPYI